MSATVTNTITETTFRIRLDPLLELWDHRLVEAVTVRVRRPENKWGIDIRRRLMPPCRRWPQPLGQRS